MYLTIDGSAGNFLEMDAMTSVCKVCHRTIPKGRVRAIPGVDTCLDHSDAVLKTERDVDLATQDREDSRHIVSQPPSEVRR